MGPSHWEGPIKVYASSPYAPSDRTWQVRSEGGYGEDHSWTFELCVGIVEMFARQHLRQVPHGGLFFEALIALLLKKYSSYNAGMFMAVKNVWMTELEQRQVE